MRFLSLKATPVFPYPSRPDVIEFDTLKRSNAHYNLQNAFNTAENKLGLTKLLDPEGESGRSELRLGKCRNCIWSLPSPKWLVVTNTVLLSYTRRAGWGVGGRREEDYWNELQLK